jgi:Acetyltransferase (GNAT) domain
LGKYAFNWVPPSELDVLIADGDPVLSSSQHFFLSPGWAKYYLPAWESKERLGAVSVDGYNPNTDARKAFAFLSADMRRSKIGVPFLSVGFNEASSPQMKFVTPEINGLYMQSRPPSPQEFTDIVAGTVELLSRQGISWGEIRLNAIPTGCALAVKQWASENKLAIHDVDIKKAYSVDLGKMRSEGVKSFIETRSSNSRAQLRKARRLVEASIGTLVLEKAQTQAQLEDWFEELKTLHRLRWRGTKDGSGFDHRPFDQFHNNVAKGLFDQKNMHLWRVRAGSTDIAYLHVFSADKRAYFNVSGINYGLASAFKPGIIAHWMVIQHYLENDIDLYDFMVGTNQYKQSLSTESKDLHFFSIRQSSVAFKIEALLRDVKRTFKGKSTE